MGDFNGIELTRKAVEAMKAAGADKAQSSLSRGEQSELNVDAGRMSLYRTTVNVSIGLTAHVGGRKGSVSINRYDDDSIREAAADAMAMARSSEPDPANDVSPARPIERFRSGAAEPDSQAMYDRLREFIDYARSAYPTTRLEQCVLDFGRGESFYTNSNGAEFEDRSGLYSFFAMFTSKDGADASSFNYSGAAHRTLGKALKDWGTIDGLMRQSAEQTRVSPVSGAFEGDLILTPDCLGDFLGYVDGVYLGDYPLITGNSPWKDKLGQPVVSPLVTVRSEPNGPAIEAGYSYTGDGFRAENCAVIEAGVLRNFTLGFYGSNKTGKPRCPSGGGAIVVDAGASALEDMVRDVKRGLLLARFSGGSPSDNGDFSGVAKNSYLIEDGKIVRPVGETMVAGNVGSLFGSVRAVSRERVDYGSAVLPYMLAGGVSVSGK
ncbi:MAG: TldD/PmbA family protein [Spirochaetes bacterium]|nr:TldD/PmbA family protein [Spirochaetota bacterium]MBU1078972.1 TldD/PmbA family protein [Spirochaetota bacterium]